MPPAKVRLSYAVRAPLCQTGFGCRPFTDTNHGESPVVYVSTDYEYHRGKELRGFMAHKDLAHLARWIGVLPAATVAFAAAQIVAIFIGWTAGAGNHLVQFAGAFMCPAAFVLAGSMTAPAYQYLTSICLTVLVAIYSTAVVTWDIIDQIDKKWDLIWLIVCSVAGILGGIWACQQIHEEEGNETRSAVSLES